MGELPGNNCENILTVSAVNKYIKESMSRDLILSNLWVRGEISNFKNHSSGHMYFTLKDENCLLKCVMFRTHNLHLRFMPENGMKVIIKGYISVFERDGQYQLYAEEMQNDGIGNLYIAFEQLKTKLSSEGLFDPAYKKKIPFMPRSIGVVTSATGSVIRDIMNVLDRRFYNSCIKIFPVRVQGESASLEISHAINKLNEIGGVEVIILARGGGSLEELWPFNEEIVARSIFNSAIPIISAVGHETDYTIADFVADLRAPTPSAAAELVMPEKLAIINRIRELNLRLVSSLLRNVKHKRETLVKLADSAAFRQPYDRIYQERMKLDVLNRDLKKSMLTTHERAKAKLGFLIGKLDALSPLTILSRGYGIIKSEKDGTLVKSVNDVDVGTEVEVSIEDGRLYCTVMNKTSYK
ncbi:exodeoxyribonuclease VII large subunit [Acetivibrio mesophilus]|uniref:Exodeoxyribonuclease 7 large subunit n=1 Tax=Acetivibrio mesophilus TaxID=2487273 RepID=A0A4Q0I9K2_9FIRM|nr:exodeoxyribonuclease VII large subunit [Acetivibrio mesophilus]ODM25308.1 exodeoxyribonuclease VII large subunit [Clostridium sp. Bc-iso-3]RXE59672.1 exodeoxyribonuclease VII large subunit [Acetivibrio mesophilus]HHV28607.1 exodeoxyribonuclease VII large subunit [Clostridium sp.]